MKERIHARGEPFRNGQILRNSVKNSLTRSIIVSAACTIHLNIISERFGVKKIAWQVMLLRL
jgi:hypothetical protein